MGVLKINFLEGGGEGGIFGHRLGRICWSRGFCWSSLGVHDPTPHGTTTCVYAEDSLYYAELGQMGCLLHQLFAIM